MDTLQKKDLLQLEGGGPAEVCGVAAGITFATYFFSPLLGLYLTSKAVGVCAIAFAVM
jgi:hypothetical protein